MQIRETNVIILKGAMIQIKIGICMHGIHNSILIFYLSTSDILQLYYMNNRKRYQSLRMKLSMWSKIFNFNIFIMLASAALTTKDYVHLISDVYNLYRPSSLILIHFTDYQNFSQMKFIFNMQLLLSKARIMTTTLNLEEVMSPNNNYNKSLRNDTKSMNVIFLTCEREIHKIRDLSKDLSFSQIMNLILFMKGFELALIEFCMNPVDNPFLLNEGVSFLVKCYRDIRIREWYSLNKKQMTIYERATWEPTTGLILRSKNLIQGEKDILNGKTLRIGTFRVSEKYEKYFANIFLALEFASNVTTKIVKTVRDLGSWNASANTWSGGMGLIINNEIDILAQMIPIMTRYTLSVDFTETLEKFDLCLYIRKPTFKVKILWSAYLKPFTYETWCALIMTFIVTVTLLTFLRLKREKGLYHGTIILENFLHIWGCYFQQGLPEFPKALTLQLFYYSTFLFGFLIFGIYSASFVSELTAVDANLPFKSLEEFLKIRSYKLAVLSLSLYDDDLVDPEWIAMKNKLIERNQAPRSMQDALNLICSKKVAFLSIDLITSRISDHTKIPCALVKVYLRRPIDFGMIIPKNSQYKKAINYYIQKLSENGILRRIGYELDDSGNEGSLMNAPMEQKFYPVSIFDVALLLAIVCGSVTLSITILFFENVYFTAHKKLNSWKLKNLRIK